MKATSKEYKKSILEGVSFNHIDELIDKLEDLREQLANGLLDQIILNGKGEEHEANLEKLFGDRIDRESIKERINQAMSALGNGRVSMKEAFGFGDETMEAFYYMGHGLFQQQNYPAARKVFSILTLVDPLKGRYHHALAAVQHKQKDYLAAVRSYASAYAFSSVENPELHFHSADCYSKMDDHLSAVVALGNCISACDERSSKHRLIKMRATTLREQILERVQRDQKEERQAGAQQQQALKKAKRRAKESGQ